MFSNVSDHSPDSEYYEFDCISPIGSEVYKLNSFLSCSKRFGMRKLTVISFLILVFIETASSQTFRYSEEVHQEFNPDVINFLADVGGFHHLLFFRNNDRPWLCIYDQQLRKKTTFRLDTKIKDNSDIRVVRFKDHYLLYIHEAGTTEHILWQIDGQGHTTGRSQWMQKLAELELAGSTETLQLYAANNDLLIASHSYFDSMQQVYSKFVRVNDQFKITEVRSTSFPFQSGAERLQQIEVEDNQLMVLKTARDEQSNHLLDLMKIDLNSNVILESTFSSGALLFSDASFIYSRSDSTTLVHAMVQSAPDAETRQQAFFLCRLTPSFKQLTPPRTFHTTLSYNNPEAFFYVSGADPQWLPVKMLIKVYAASFQKKQNFFIPEELKSLRLVHLSDDLVKIRDTVLNEKNDGPKFIPYTNSSFRLQNSSYLLLTQKLPRNNTGLVLFSTDASGAFRSTDLPVYNKNEYRISLAQPVGLDAFLVPYRNKRDVGLLRISLKE